MDKRDKHRIKSPHDRIRYRKALKSLAKTEETVFKEDFDSSDSSTSNLDLTVSLPRRRPRSFGNRILNRQTFSVANIVKVFVSLGGLAILGFFLTNIITLNRDLGRVEERVEDIPALGEKIDKIYEKLVDIDKSVLKIKAEVEKNNEINNLKFDALNKRIDSIKNQNSK